MEAAKDGKAPPKAISDRPHIAEENLDMWNAFADLSRARACGFAPEPIPCSEVEAWCRMHGVEAWQRRSYWRVVQALDMEALAHAAKKERAQ